MSLTKFIRRTLIGCAVLACVLTAIELALRLALPAIYETDSELGWKTVPNLVRTIDNVRFDQSPYKATITTNSLGLRDSGVTRDTRITMLVIGDSFTADPFSGNDDMWYVVGSRNLEKLSELNTNSIRSLAGGGGGYGTLQEFMLLKRLKKAVSPDLFVLQFCANDFANNYMPLESRSIVRNQYMRRPYYALDGSIQYVDSPFAWLWRMPPTSESKIFNKLDTIIQVAQYNYYHDYYPSPLAQEVKVAYDKDMLAITSELLKKIRQEMAGIPAVMVNCSSTTEGLNAQWRRIAREAGFEVLSLPSDALAENQGDKKLFYADGGHLSPEGNLLYGTKFAAELYNSRGYQSMLAKHGLKPASSNR